MNEKKPTFTNVDESTRIDDNKSEGSKSTQLRRSQAVSDFLRDCKGYAPGAIGALVHLSTSNKVSFLNLSEQDAYCLTLYLDDDYSDTTIDARKIQDHRVKRAIALWRTAQMYIDRDTMADTCMALMGFATDFSLMRTSKETIEARIRSKSSESDKHLG